MNFCNCILGGTKACFNCPYNNRIDTSNEFIPEFKNINYYSIEIDLQEEKLKRAIYNLNRKIQGD